MPHHHPDKIVAILCEAFYEIAGSSCKVYDSDSYYYDFGDKNQYDEIIQKVVQEMELTSEDRFSYLAYLRHPYRNDSRVDLRPVYEHIFRFLKSEGFNWRFKEVYFEFILNLKREIEAKNSTIGNEEDDFSLGPLESIASYLEIGERNSENGELVFPDFGTEFVNYDMEPDPILKTYIDVYGVNPVGYPPRMTDYI